MLTWSKAPLLGVEQLVPQFVTQKELFAVFTLPFALKSVIVFNKDIMGIFCTDKRSLKCCITSSPHAF